MLLLNRYAGNTLENNSVYIYHFESESAEELVRVPGVSIVGVDGHCGDLTLGSFPRELDAGAGVSFGYDLALNRDRTLSCRAIRRRTANSGSGFLPVHLDGEPAIMFDSRVFLVVSHIPGVPVLRIPVEGNEAAPATSWSKYEQPELVAVIESVSASGRAFLVEIDRKDSIMYRDAKIPVSRSRPWHGFVDAELIPRDVRDRHDPRGVAFLCELGGSVNRLNKLIPSCLPVDGRMFDDKFSLAKGTAG